MSNDNASSPKEAFLLQLQSVIALLSSMIAGLKEEKCPSIPEIEHCTEELKKLNSLHLLLQENLISPILDCLDSFMTITPKDNEFSEDIENLKTKATELRAKLQKIKASELDAIQKELEPYRILTAVIFKQGESTVELTTEESKQEMNLVKSLNGQLTPATLLRIAYKMYTIGSPIVQGSKEQGEEQPQIASSLVENASPASQEHSEIQKDSHENSLANNKVIETEETPSSSSDVVGESEQPAPIEQTAIGTDGVEAESEETKEEVVSDEPVPQVEKEPVETGSKEEAKSSPNGFEDIEGEIRYDEQIRQISWNNIYVARNPRDKNIKRDILSFMTHFCMVSIEQIVSFFCAGKSKDISFVNEFLDKLYKDGIIGRIKPMDGHKKLLKGHWYCLSNQALAEIPKIGHWLSQAGLPPADVDVSMNEQSKEHYTGVVHFPTPLTNGIIDNKTMIYNAYFQSLMLTAQIFNGKDALRTAPKDSISWNGEYYSINISLGNLPQRWYSIIPEYSLGIQLYEKNLDILPECSIILFASDNEPTANEIIPKIKSNFPNLNPDQDVYLARIGKPMLVLENGQWRTFDGKNSSPRSKSAFEEDKKTGSKPAGQGENKATDKGNAPDEMKTESPDAEIVNENVSNGENAASVEETPGTNDVQEPLMPSNEDTSAGAKTLDELAPSKEIASNQAAPGSKETSSGIQTNVDSTKQSIKNESTQENIPEEQNNESSSTEPTGPDTEIQASILPPVHVKYVPSVVFGCDDYDTKPELTASKLAESLLNDDSYSPQSNYDDSLLLIYKILNEGMPTRYEKDHILSSLGDAMLVCKAFAATEPGNDEMYNDLFVKLAYATDTDITGGKIYSGYNLPQILDTNFQSANYIKIPALLRALFSPENSGDYSLKTYARNFLEQRDVWSGLDEVREVFSLLLSLHDSPNRGYTTSVLGAILKKDSKNKELRALAHQAELLSNPPSSIKKIKSSFSEELFGNSSDITSALNCVIKNDVYQRDYVKLVLDEFAYDDKIELAGRISAIIQKAWKNLNLSGAKKILDGWIYTQSERPLTQRLDLLKKWYDATENEEKGQLERLAAKRGELLKRIDLAIASLEDKNNVVRLFIGNMLMKLRERLSGHEKEIGLTFGTILHTGWFILSEDMQPIVDKQSSSLYFEPWRNALRHIVSERPGLDEILQKIADSTIPDECSMFDNLSSMSLISEIKNNGAHCQIPSDDLKNAERQIDILMEDYQGHIELAYAYGQISELQKENMLSDIQSIYDNISGYNEFGYMRRFLASIKQRIDLLAQQRKEEFAPRITALENSIPKEHIHKHELLGKVRELVLGVGNYEVAEEYLNRCEANPETDIETSEDEPPKLRFLEEFLNEDSYSKKYDVCQRTDNGHFTPRTIWQFFPEGQSNKKSSEDLINAWQGAMYGKGESDICDKLSAVFKSLGFSNAVIKTTQSPSPQRIYKLNFTPRPKNLPRYTSPFAAFGTMPPPNMDVVRVNAKMDVSQLVNIIVDSNLSNPAFLLWDKSLTLQRRRQIIEELHRRKYTQTCILIDKVLLTYLATKTNDKFEALLNCSLPFTFIQPFSDQKGYVADEMFRGRETYLKEITEAGNVPSMLLYGGRQLGKTAILQRAANMVHAPENKDYAIYISIKQIHTEEEIVKAIKFELGQRKIHIAFSTLQEFFYAIRPKFGYNDSEYEIHRLLLLLDEADNFLHECSLNNYELLTPFVDLSRQTNNRFKFVLAGLHNVVRASNAKANNSVLGQLAHKCVKPFTPYEARQLLQIPLDYLGFSFTNDEKLELILSKSNYYPGILHFFGLKLLESMANQYSAHYSAQAGNPPCLLSEPQLQTAIADQDMNNAINEKLEWTLDLDPNYRLLAFCIAWNYYADANQKRNGSTVDEILEAAALHDINQLDELKPDDCKNLLEEMREMALLQNVGHERYRLRKSSFLALFGKNSDEVDAGIEAYLKGLK